MQKGLLGNVLIIFIYFIIYQVAILPLILSQMTHNIFVYALCAVLGLVASYYLARNLWNFLNDNFTLEVNRTSHPIIELILFVIALIAIQFFSDNLPVSNNQSVILEALKDNTFNTILTTVVVSPIIEELIFRGLFAKLIFSKMKSFISIFLYVLITSLVFAWAHEQSFSLKLIPYFLSGILFSLAYIRFGDIRYSMFLHFLNNFIATITVILPLIY
ncbi:CPBP family intramembrane glutamic endopeptidase [Companilactobacillus insicii]|uniref:CPBP family intramembrane glutamic endopeptidase n=1 Tax=Companilactobacillus insicii TaxID=1732567 RepID=UPI000F77A48E|nr:CPBP family intramembrane glutamic endopeptidase [Companilactobacillus insicii]